MPPCFSQFKRSVDGTTAVEFALISLPMLLLLLAGMEYGRLMWTRQALQETAVAGARCMGLVQTECGTAGVYSSSLTTTYVESIAAKWSVPLTASNITLNAAATCGGVTGFSQVSVTYTFVTLAPQLLVALSGGTALSASACFPNHP
jgi:Flp pilus assembly protein TadG